MKNSTFKRSVIFIATHIHIIIDILFTITFTTIVVFYVFGRVRPLILVYLFWLTLGAYILKTSIVISKNYLNRGN
jgi:hypothetical protein